MTGLLVRFCFWGFCGCSYSLQIDTQKNHDKVSSPHLFLGPSGQGDNIMFKRLFFTTGRALLGVLLLAVFFTFTAYAQADAPPPVELPGVAQLVAALIGIPGFALLASAVVNAFKRIGWVTDGTSGTWLTGFNLLGIVLLFIAGVFNVKFDPAVVSEQLGLVANVILAVIALFGQNGISVNAWYPLLKQLKLPLISTSFQEMPAEIKNKLAKG